MMGAVLHTVNVRLSPEQVLYPVVEKVHPWIFSR